MVAEKYAKGIEDHLHRCQGRNDRTRDPTACSKEFWKVRRDTADIRTGRPGHTAPALPNMLRCELLQHRFIE